MNDTQYTDVIGINTLQRKIMLFVDYWVRSEKTPIPQKAIIDQMKYVGVKTFTTVNAINSLLKKGYIRRAVITSNKSYYVQLRRV